MKQVMTLTNEAVGRIKSILTKAPSGEDSLLIGIDKSGCSGYSYKLDFAKSSEMKNFDCITKDGVKVFIEPKATIFLIGSTMDYKKDSLSSRFVFDNPNEKNTCGCGESFNI